MPSFKLRSISFSTSLLPPLNIIVHAFGSLQIRYVKYSSPIFLTSNNSQLVP